VAFRCHDREASGVDEFRKISRGALDEFAVREVSEDAWRTFAGRLDYVPLSLGPEHPRLPLRQWVVRTDLEAQLHRPGADRRSDPESETEAFVATRCSLDNWRWAGVPFYLRTGKRMAAGQRILSIAFRGPSKSMFPANSGVGAQGPDHLTFALADSSKMSLSFYGKRPGPGMRLDKPGSWGPNAIHQLVAPRAWRLPFERVWRDPNRLGS
jgi:glucose-6-phosphate 1-dehydrogenase